MEIEKEHWNLSLQTPLEETPPPPPELISFVTVFSERVYSTDLLLHERLCKLHLVYFSSTIVRPSSPMSSIIDI